MAGGISREKVIVRTSTLGIAVNVLLVIFKAMVGIISGSIAIVLDAVNNLTDAISSIVTIVGIKLAGKKADEKHPLGHGRIEYITTSVISIIIIYAGITSLVESVKKIIHPQEAKYTAVTLIVVAVAVVVKIVLGLFVKLRGKEVNSDTLAASGSDALFDSIISAATLVSAFIFMFTKVSTESWLGAVISLIIIKSGFEMISDAASQIIGKRPDSKLSLDVYRTINEHKEILGTYDLIMHDYGPDKIIASVHIEVPDYYTAKQIDKITRHIEKDVMEKNHVILTGVGIYSVNTDDECKAMRNKIIKVAVSEKYVLQIHGIYINEEEKNIQFDLVIDFAAKDKSSIIKNVENKLKAEFPEYTFSIIADSDISDVSKIKDIYEGGKYYDIL